MSGNWQIPVTNGLSGRSLQPAAWSIEIALSPAPAKLAGTEGSPPRMASRMLFRGPNGPLARGNTVQEDEGQHAKTEIPTLPRPLGVPRLQAGCLQDETAFAAPGCFAYLFLSAPRYGP